MDFQLCLRISKSLKNSLLHSFIQFEVSGHSGIHAFNTGHAWPIYISGADAYQYIAVIWRSINLSTYKCLILFIRLSRQIIYSTMDSSSSLRASCTHPAGLQTAGGRVSVGVVLTDGPDPSPTRCLHQLGDRIPLWAVDGGLIATGC